MPEIRALVVYYSRGGNSRRVAQDIAVALGGADLEEIRDTAVRTGFRGYLRSCIDSIRERTTTLASRGRDVSGYDLVVVGGPVWVGEPSSPIRSWLRLHAAELHNVAFFLTHGGSARDQVFAAMTAESRNSPLALMSVREGELGSSEVAVRTVVFVAALRRALAPQPAAT
jgi:flavodoxin